MLSKVSRLLSKLNFPIFHIFLISIFSFLSLHETLNMFFIGDDFGFVYRLKNHGVYTWPQHHLVNMYRPLYDLFGIEPSGYFAVGLLFFIISAVLFYFLARSIFSNNFYALAAGLIYATAPTGIESVEMMVVYLATYYALALFSLILIFFIKFLRTGRILFFILSSVILSFSFETVTYRAFLFPIVMFPLGLFFWDRKKLQIKKLAISYGIIIILFLFFYLFRVFLFQWNSNFTSLKTNLDLNYVMIAWKSFQSRFISQFPGNNYFSGFFEYLFGSMYASPIRALYPIIGTINIIFTIPSGKVIPLLHIPLSLAVILFSVFLLKKKKKIGSFNINIYFASLAFIFFAVLAYFLPYTRNLMPAKDHYATYTLPGYALFFTSVFIVLINLLNKQKITFLKLIPYLVLLLLIFINLKSNRNDLTEYNRRVFYVRPFFEQIKELQPTLPSNPIIYIQPVVNADDDPAEAKWRLYDIWHGGIKGPNIIFGLLYNNVKVDETIAASTREAIEDVVKKDPKLIDLVYSFDYDLNGLHPTTDKVRKKLQSEILQKN